MFAAKILTVIGYIIGMGLTITNKILKNHHTKLRRSRNKIAER